MFLGMMQIVIAHKWYLYPPIILGPPFINVIYPLTIINAKGFSTTYEERNISYTFITDPISRDINALINLKQKHGSSSGLSVRLNDISENSPLYAQLREYLSQKQSDIFTSIAKEDIDDIKSFEKVSNKEMMFLLENSKIQRKKKPGRYSSDT
ncbi:hypothetical protein H5410_021079 [Solanum commersonii]|uniref:Uncharacterized protein n=1 Tax=Solanum commersonii TaxID=4109 RepID=A0A9J5ZG43_SOLCO|nr:hypothetical protein H5410_021079 [Solanum commersonii]